MNQNFRIFLNYSQLNWENNGFNYSLFIIDTDNCLLLEAKWNEFERHIKWLVFIITHSRKQFPVTTWNEMKNEQCAFCWRQKGTSHSVKPSYKLRMSSHNSRVKFKRKTTWNYQTLVLDKHVVFWVWLTYSGMDELWTRGIALAKASWSDIYCWE